MCPKSQQSLLVLLLSCVLEKSGEISHVMSLKLLEFFFFCRNVTGSVTKALFNLLQVKFQSFDLFVHDDGSRVYPGNIGCEVGIQPACAASPLHSTTNTHAQTHTR